MRVGDGQRDAAIAALADDGMGVRLEGADRLWARVTEATPAAALGRAGRCALRLARAVRSSAAGLAAEPAVAERLRELATPGEALITADDARLVESSLRLRVAADRRLEPLGLDVYAIVGAGPRRAHDEGLAPRLLSPFVGRQHELDVIGRAVERARGGSGGLLAVAGAPGIGKSRLVFEARRRLPGAHVTYLEGRCVAYGRGVPLLPVLDLLRDNCGIDAGDARAVISAKVRGALEELGIPLEEAAPYLLRLFGLAEATRGLEGISPEAVRARTLQVLREMALRGSRRRTLVLVVEDLHWADETSERFIEDLLPSLPGHPLLVIVTHRSGHGPAWPPHEAVTELRLDPLAEADASRIVHRAVGARSMDAEVMGAILDRGEGNPLYLEELGRAVRDTSRRGGGQALPDSLEDSLRARLLRLPGELRRLLEVASVIGRRFPRDLLLTVAEPGEDPERALESLVREEFVHGEGDPAEPVLAFDHVLVQDAVYRSVPPVRRRELHAAIARELSRRAGGRDEEIIHQLAHHWSKAERAREAVAHLRRSAELSARGYGHEEADRTLQRATAHAEGLPEEEREPVLRDLAVRRTSSLYFLGEVRQSVGLLSRLDPGARADGGDPGQIAELRFWLAHGHSHLGNPDEAHAAARDSAALAARAGKTAVLGRARYVLAREGWWTGRWADGIAEGEAAVPILEETGQDWWLGHCLCYIGHGHRSLGRFDRAITAASRAREVGDASGDPRVRSFSGWSRGWYLACMGRTEESIEACEEAIAVSPDPANSAWALGFLGFAHGEHGNAGRAIDELGRAIDAVRRAEHPRVQCWFEGWIADAHLAVGRPHDARAAARSALTTARLVRCPWAAAHATRSLGRIALAEGGHADAERLLRESIAAYTALGGDFDHAVALLDAARCARLTGDQETGRARAEEAGRILAPLPVPRWHVRAEEAMSPAPL